MKTKIRLRLPIALATYCLLFLPNLLNAQGATGTVLVRISGIHSSKGKVEVRLWNGKEGFPKDDTKAVRRASVEILNGTATATFADVPVGTYAISAFHDENGNGKMDTRFPGIPIEGVGVSNDPHKRFGPPAFDACKFTVTPSEAIIPIVVEY